MKRNTLFILVLVVLVLTFSTYLQAEERVLTKEEAIEIAQEKNPEIQRLHKEVEIAKTGIELARSGYWPNLDLSSSYTRLGDPPSVPTLEGGQLTLEDGPKDNYALSLNLQQPIYLGGQIRAGYRLAEIAVEAAQAQLKEQQQELTYQVSEAYYNVLKTEELVELAKQEKDRLGEYVHQAETNYEVGLATSTDLLQAEINYNRSQQALLRAENALQLARLSFQNTLNLEEEDFTLSGDLDWEEEDIFLAELKDYAFTNRIDLEQLELQEDRLKQELRQAQAQRRPQLSFSGDYSTEDDSFFELRDGDWSVSLALNYNLFDGGESRSRVKQQEQELSKLEISRQQLEDLIELEIQESLLSLKESKQQLELMELNLKQAEKNLAEMEVKFREGLITSLELLEAQHTYQEVKTDYLEAIYDYNLAIAKIDKVSARNLD
ncbi:TolC family protein [Fuchsiella alkaliacetigena]|uniref:TolC family protein n=1 Tax=Fuchsiella alkaliacetigena TaxID=957042 RepID=UPI00200B2D13|nr:TolC family protein [Fuchsiella alkaliacetigena]MCK8823591.1 TolC family protein [Fuchsiella alkaliacetigena]